MAGLLGITMGLSHISTWAKLPQHVGTPRTGTVRDGLVDNVEIKFSSWETRVVKCANHNSESL